MPDWDDVPLQKQLSSPEGLSRDIWPNILRRLDTCTRLSARCVCKAFQQLTPDDTINIALHKPPEDKALSMLQFLTQQARLARRGPNLDLKLEASLDYAHRNVIHLIRPCVYAALSCANLQSLCFDVELSKPEALTFLKLAPCGLRALSLYTSMGVASDVPSWQRLGSLSRLELNTSKSTHHDEVYDASGIAALAALENLSIIYGPEYNAYRADARDCLDVSELEFASLRTLSYDREPFSPICFSALEELVLLYPEGSVPDGVWRRSIKCLGCCNWPSTFRYPSDVVDALQCMIFRVFLSSSCNVLQMGPLLDLPAAKWLHVSQSQALSMMRSPGVCDNPPLSLTGTFEQYQQLLKKLQFKFDPDVQVQVRFDSDQIAHPISSNGHALLCKCAECQ